MPAPAGVLFDQLRLDAAAAAGRLVEEADTSAKRIVDEARTSASQRRVAATTEGARAAALALESARAEVAQRVRRETLDARAAALDRVFAAAAASVHLLGAHPRLGEAIGRSIARTLAFLPDGPLAVRCAAALGGLARQALADLGRAGDDVRIDEGCPFGVKVESLDGTITVDETFPSALARARPRLSIDLATQIEGHAP